MSFCCLPDLIISVEKYLSVLLLFIFGLQQLDCDLSVRVVLGTANLDLLSFLNLWVGLFHVFGHFSASSPPTAAFSQKPCILRSLKTAILPPQPPISHIKCIAVSLSSVTALGLGHTTIPSSCPGLANAERVENKKQKKQLLTVGSLHIHSSLEYSSPNPCCIHDYLCF